MNWQNIPRDDLTIKRAVIPKRGAFSLFDYSQVEPRLFGYFTAVGLKDTTIADWYRAGRDVYVEIASRAFGVPAERITPEQRQQGKVFFLMSLYGAGPRKMSQTMGMPESEAKEFYRNFHAGLPQIRGLSNPPPRKDWGGYEPGLIERTIQRRGYLKTMWGRHLHVPEYGEHKLLNTLIQGSAADLMKASLIRVDRALREPVSFDRVVTQEIKAMAWMQDYLKRLESDPVLQSRMVSVIHDEIILDGPVEEVPILHELIPPLMREERITEVIPLDIDHEVSTTSWADKEEYEEWQKSRQRATTSVSH